MTDSHHTAAENFWDKARTVLGVGTAAGAIATAILGKGEQDAGRHVLAGAEYIIAGAGLVATIALYKAHRAFNREKIEAKKEALQAKWGERGARIGEWLAPRLLEGIERAEARRNPQPVTAAPRPTVSELPGGLITLATLQDYGRFAPQSAHNPAVAAQQPRLVTLADYV